MNNLARTVIDLGECDYDHPQIKALLEPLGVRVLRAHTFQDAREHLNREKIDLVLVNRVTDCDGTFGIEFIKEIKANPLFSAVRTMMVSNYEDAQAAAVKEGALLGFGKKYLDAPETLMRLKAALSLI